MGPRQNLRRPQRENKSLHTHIQRLGLDVATESFQFMGVPSPGLTSLNLSPPDRDLLRLHTGSLMLVRQTFRSLLKQPGFLIAIVLTIAIGISANVGCSASSVTRFWVLSHSAIQPTGPDLADEPGCGQLSCAIP